MITCTRSQIDGEPSLAIKEDEARATPSVKCCTRIVRCCFWRDDVEYRKLDVDGTCHRRKVMSFHGKGVFSSPFQLDGCGAGVALV